MSALSRCTLCLRAHLPGPCPNTGEVDPYGDTPPPRDPLINSRIDDFEILERIGAGGMGFVYRGRHTVIDRPVAIKVLKAELVGGAVGPTHGLLKEARAISTIRHRGIVDIFGFGTLITGQQYMVMELLEGEPLDKVLKVSGKLSAEQTLNHLEEIFSALDAAHRAGVIHRDLKPSNVFVVRQGEERFLKLLDFGLAKKDVGMRGESPQTNANAIAGTPQYMAPEQAKGLAVGPYSDLYSAGVIGFEMLTGRIPFDGASAIEILIAHVQKPVPAIGEGVPQVVEDFIHRLLAKEPTKRPANAEDALAELKAVRAALGDPVRKRVSPRRARRAAAIGVAASVVLLGALGVVLMNPQPKPPAIAPTKPPPPPPLIVEVSKPAPLPPPPVVVEPPPAKVSRAPKKMAEKPAPEKAPMVVVVANVSAPQTKIIEVPTPQTERTRLLSRIAQLEQRFSQKEEPDQLGIAMLASYRQRALKAESIDQVKEVGALVDEVEKRFNRN